MKVISVTLCDWTRRFFGPNELTVVLLLGSGVVKCVVFADIKIHHLRKLRFRDSIKLHKITTTSALRLKIKVCPDRHVILFHHEVLDNVDRNTTEHDLQCIVTYAKTHYFSFFPRFFMLRRIETVFKIVFSLGCISYREFCSKISRGRGQINITITNKTNI